MDELRFAVLGPVRGHYGDIALKMGSPQQQAMLARLLLGRGGAATIGQLVDALWGEKPPVAAVTTVRTYASRWRKLLEADPADPGVLISSGDGYRLVLPDRAVDAQVVEMLAARAERARGDGRPAEARDLLNEALVRWQGEPLTGVPGPFAVRERNRLSELRLALLEERIALDLGLGRAARCVPELTALTAELPLREEPYRLLMLALYRSGRKADACAVYEAACRIFMDEMFAEPGKELTQLYRSMLKGEVEPDRSSAPPAAETPYASPSSTAHADVLPTGHAEPETLPALPRPAQLPPEPADFTGREALTDVLVAALTSPAHRALPVVMLVGMGGAGKTTLAVHVAHLVRNAFPDGQLYASLHGGDAAPAGTEQVLTGFLAALGAGTASLSDGLETSSARFRSLVDRRRLLIVLDDAKDLAQILPLMPGTADCAVLITSRRRLPGLPVAFQTNVEAFRADEAIELMGRVIGADRLAAEPGAAEELVETCGRLPLAVRIVAARLAARPGWRLSTLLDRLADERRWIDELRIGDLTVQAAFELSYQQLNDEQGRAFALLAVADTPDIALAAAAALLDREEDRAEALLEELVDVVLLESPAPGRYRFHSLLRAFARRVCEVKHPGAASGALSRVLDFFLAAAGSAFQHAVPGDPVSEALTPVRSAGLVFCDLAAARSWARAEMDNVVALATQIARITGPASVTDVRMAIDLLIMFSPFGPDPRYEQSTDTVRALGDAAERIGDVLAAGRAHFLCGHLALAAARPEAAERSAQRAVLLCRQADDPVILRQACNDLGLIAQMLGHFDEAVDHYDEALVLARRLGHRSGELVTTINTALARVRSGRADEAVTICQKVLAENTSHDDPATAYAVYVLAVALAESDRHEEAADRFVECVRMCVAAGLRDRESQARYRLADALRALGQPELAAAEASHALSLCEQTGDRRDRGHASAALGRALVELGQLTEAQRHLRQAHDLYLLLSLPEAAETARLLAELAGNGRL